MYSIYVSKELIWSPNTMDRGYIVLNPTISMEINQPWTLEFDIPYGSIGYNKIAKMISTIEVRDDNETIYVGRCISIERDTYGIKHFVCESEIAWLQDAVIRPYSFSKSPTDYAAWLTSTYNGQVSSNRRITFETSRTGSSPSSGGTGNTIDTSNYPTLRTGSHNDYVTILQTILTELGYGSGLNPSAYGWYGSNTEIAVTNFQTANGLGPSGLGICGPNTWAKIQEVYTGSATVTNTSYTNEEYRQFDEEITTIFAPAEAGVDTWEDFEKTSSFLKTTYTRDSSDNLSIKIKCINNPDKTVSSQEIASGVNLIEFSELISADDIYTVIVPVGKKDDNDAYLTVASVNSGKDYIEADSTIISTFGRIVRTVSFSDIEDANELLLKGTEELNMNIEAALTVTISAVDLHLIDSSTSPIRIGDYHWIILDPIQETYTYRCTKIDMDLMNPDKTIYTFGTDDEKITNAVASNAK